MAHFTKRLSFFLALLALGLMAKAQHISHIETTKNWYYIYEQSGKQAKTLSRSIGELQGFGSSFFIVKTGSWYYIYDARGNKTKTLSISSVGKVLSVTGDTFTTRLGSWIYTWSKDGKKISTRSSSQHPPAIMSNPN